jgi:aldehyde dehydrogenase (NAD+)
MKAEFNVSRTKDLGTAPFTNWMYELLTVTREVDHTLAHLHEWMKAKDVDTPVIIGPAKSFIIAEPLGVVTIIGSWNYPILTTLCPLVSAIAAGNVAVIKPSEVAPWCSHWLNTFFKRYLD